MRCDNVKLFVHDYVDGYLSQEQSSVIQNHLSRCVTCRQMVDEVQCIKQELAQLPDYQLSDDFIGNALTNAEAHHKTKKRHNGFTIPSYYAIAASLVVVSFIGLFMWQTPGTMSPGDGIVSTQQAQNVNMVFNVPKALSDVTFTVILPENVEMEGYPGEKEIRWNSTLEAGRNLLTLPIVATSANEGVLITKLYYENSSKVFEVIINASKPKQVT